MRIALVVPYCLDVPGGVATHAIGLAAWLRGRGQDARIIAPGTAQVDVDVPVTLLGGSVDLPFNGSVARLALRPDQARAALRATTGADLVHVHEPLTPGAGFAVASRTRLPLVVTHHASFTPSPTVARLLRARARRLPPRVSLAVSEAAWHLTTRIGVTDAVIVPNAIALPPAPSPRAGRPTVAFVGRLDEPRKGYRVFVEAAALVQGADFIAVGPGGHGAPGVTELGALGRRELGEVLGSASILVAPNLFGESFGMVLVEGLAHGAAVVASDLPAFRAVAEGPASSFFPVGDASAAAEAIEKRLADPVDPVSAGRSAARFGWDAIGPAVEAAYGRSR